MKILLTGGAGFIGAEVLRTYLRAGHEVIVVDNLSRAARRTVPQGVRLYQLDVLDHAAMRDLLQQEQPQVVNHHAALVSVRESVHIPKQYFAVNVHGTRNLLRAAQACGAKKFIFASSGGAVYGEAERLPIPEEHPLAPLSPYGESKKLAERLIREQNGHLETVLLRYGNVYGTGQDSDFGNGAIAIFLRDMIDGQPITIFGDGRQVRDYLHVDDAARANLVALEPGLQGTFNIATGEGRDLLAVVEAIANLLEVSPNLRMEAFHEYEVGRNVLQVDRARRVLHWQPRLEFEEGLRKTISTYRRREPSRGTSVSQL